MGTHSKLHWPESPCSQEVCWGDRKLSGREALSPIQDSRSPCPQGGGVQERTVRGALTLNTNSLFPGVGTDQSDFPTRPGDRTVFWWICLWRGHEPCLLMGPLSSRRPPGAKRADGTLSRHMGVQGHLMQAPVPRTEDGGSQQGSRRYLVPVVS